MEKIQRKAHNLTFVLDDDVNLYLLFRLNITPLGMHGNNNVKKLT